MLSSYFLLVRPRELQRFARLLRAYVGSSFFLPAATSPSRRRPDGEDRWSGAPVLDVAGSKRREALIDFYRSCSMLFVFYHHTANVFPNSVDLFPKFNPFAELFIAISGFMVGLVYLHRDGYRPLVVRGLKILAAYFVVSVPVAMGIAGLGSEREPIG